MVTMGNLFSGSGTWELAAQICGMEVKFEAEIEKFPVAVEAKRFPNAIQLGDVSKIDGRDIPIVDFICNSSPCQDLSVAGKRAGLAGERSGLFDQAIRITKEMREHDEQLKRVTGADVPRGLIRPRIFGWENVPGALSSGAEKGADFREVLSSIVGIVEEKHSDIPIPRGGVAQRRTTGRRWMASCLAYLGRPIRRMRYRPTTETFVCYRGFWRTPCRRNTI